MRHMTELTVERKNWKQYYDPKHESITWDRFYDRLKRRGRKHGYTTMRDIDIANTKPLQQQRSSGVYVVVDNEQVALTKISEKARADYHSIYRWVKILIARKVTLTKKIVERLCNTEDGAFSIYDYVDKPTRPKKLRPKKHDYPKKPAGVRFKIEGESWPMSALSAGMTKRSRERFRDRLVTKSKASESGSITWDEFRECRDRPIASKHRDNTYIVDGVELRPGQLFDASTAEIDYRRFTHRISDICAGQSPCILTSMQVSELLGNLDGSPKDTDECDLYLLEFEAPSGETLHKIGISLNHKIRLRALKCAAKRSGFAFRRVSDVRTGSRGEMRDIETRLKNLTASCSVDFEQKFEGSSEFRRLPPETLDLVRSHYQ